MNYLKSLFILVFLTSVIYSQTTETYTSKWSMDHGYHVFDVCFSPDGSKVLGIEGTVSLNSVKLFNAGNGQLIWSRTAAAEMGMFSHDMSKIFIGGASTLAINAVDGTDLWLNNQSSDCMDVNSTSTRVVVGKEIDRGHGKVVMINAETGVKIWEGTTQGPVNSIKFSPDGSKVISGGGDLYDREAILWDSQTGSKIWTSLSSTIILTVNFSPNGNSIIVGTDWQNVFLLNASSGAVVWNYTLTERFYDSAFSPDSKKVFLCKTDGVVIQFDTDSGTKLWENKISTSTLRHIRSSPDGLRIAVSSDDKNLHILDMLGGTELFKGLHTNQVNSLNYSRDGTRIVTGTFYGGKVSVWQKDGTVGVENFAEELPLSLEVGQNYPNPFNPTTTIHYSLPTQSHVKINIYNGLGEKVAQLLDKHKAPGRHSLVFDGSSYGSGVYFYEIVANDSREVRKMLMLK